MSHRKTDLGILCRKKICQSSAKARGLNADDAYRARREALLWLHVGPCMGSTKTLAKEDGESVPHLFMPKPSTFEQKPTIVAREIVTVLLGRTLGRGKDDLLCELAKEMTAPVEGQR